MYYLDIIDTTSPLVQLAQKEASANGITLEWSGSDAKDDQTIVASNLKFDMLTLDASDAAFIDFFTGDEHKFKVLLKDNVDDSVLWQGYILPDLYDEPYKNVNFFVKFTATDGLGRLKGKYLPEEYYNREKSLIDIYSQILRLTGLDLELYFSPAIENFVEKDWNKIYLDGTSFLEGTKKQDAYKIIDTLLADTLCVCYQCDNRWYIEGINIRHLRKVSYKKYDANGNFIQTINSDRLIKLVTRLVTPNITIIPPYNEITTIHKKTKPALPKTVSNETNDDWALVTGVIGIIHASQWMANGGFYAKCVAPGYFVTNYNQYYFDGNNATTHPQDDTKFISLREKLYFEAGTKVKFVLDFKTVHRDPAIGGPGSVSTWNNCFKYEILFNGVVLYSNFVVPGTPIDVIEDREALIFSTEGVCKLEIDHVFITEGLLDIRLYQVPGRVADTGVLGIMVNELKVEVIGFIEEVAETNLINGDFTIDKEIDLTYGEDKSGFSKGFRLYKLKEDTAFFNEIEVPIYYGFSLNDKFYTVVQLEGANLIAKNKHQVFHSSEKVFVNDVIYNFENGEQMVIETNIPFTTGSFFVKKYGIADFVESRTHWTQWTDAFYKIENNSYVKTIANIYRRIFNVAHEKIDFTALNAVKFNDIVQFHYQFLKDFTVLNCSWDLDANKTTLTIGRANYKDATGTTPGDQNIPPIVVAGDDIFITDAQTTASFLATAYDPDGFITSQIWTKTVGGAGDVIVSPTQLATDISNLTADFYTYKIEVTDNSGGTASDTINIIRSKNYTVTLDLFQEITNPKQPQLLKRIYKLNVSPQIVADSVLTFKGEFHLETVGGMKVGISDIYTKATAWYEINKNGVSIAGKVNFVEKNRYIDERIPMTLNFMATDEIYITLGSQFDGKHYRNGAGAISTFKLQTATITSGVGTITGLPIEKETLLYH